jgi:hypothetical protein
MATDRTADVRTDDVMNEPYRWSSDYAASKDYRTSDSPSRKPQPRTQKAATKPKH